MRVRRLLVFSLLIWLLMACPVWSATYYIDYDSGADTNNGTAKETPWKHAPGMVGCSDTCLTVKTAGVQPGDNIILKGGVTWPNAALGWLINFSGNATDASPGCTGTGCIYLGVDAAWYTGAAWARPILNAGGSKTATDAGGVKNYLMRLYANYIIVDSLEFTGLYWDAVDDEYGNAVNIHIAGGTANKGTNITLKNLYIHGWTHDTLENGTSDRSCGICGDTSIPNNNTNTILQDSVIDGSDTDKESCGGVFGSPPYIVNNYFSWMRNAIISNGTKRIYGNTILNIGATFDPTAHNNAILINAAQDYEISSNLIGSLTDGAQSIFAATNQGSTGYVFNNVIYDISTQQPSASQSVVNNGCEPDPERTTLCLNAGTVYFINNTVESGPDSAPNLSGFSINPATTAVYIYNNHVITSVTTPNSGVWSASSGSPTVTASDNLVQSKATANGQGYTSAQTYPFSPTDGTDGTVAVGSDKTALCSGDMAGLCSTSGVGVAYNATAHTVSYPLLTQTTRPDGSAWDIGAYDFSWASSYALTVTKAGSGTGTVTSNVGSIDCGETCTDNYDGTVVTLTATATSPNYFAGWSGTGGCTGTSTCQLTMSAARAVTATFSRYGTFTPGAGGSVTLQ